LKALRDMFAGTGREIMVASALTGLRLAELKERLAEILDEMEE
jgi:hypothetical protein